MKNLFIYLFIHLFTKCQNHDFNKSIKSIKEDNVLSENVINNKSLEAITTLSIDTLSINRALFNNEPFNIKYNDLKTKKKDSMFFSEWACGSPFEWVSDSLDGYDYYNYYSYYTKNHLEYITNKHDAILFSGNFVGNNTLQIMNTDIELTKNTTINEFKVFFPKSYSHYLKTKAKFSVDYKDGGYIYVSFKIDYPEDHWIFYFDHKGYLIRFELYWWLC